MENKKDWEEIEKWNNQKHQDVKDEYGIDITELGKDMNKFDKFFNVVGRTCKTIIVATKIILAIAAIIGFILFVNYFVNIRQQLNSNNYTSDNYSNETLLNTQI